MSLDQELFQELASLLIETCKAENEDIHFLTQVWPDCVDKKYWFGEKLSGESSYVIDNTDISCRITDITKELHRYYHETGLGNWNLMYFKVLVKEERFTVDFEKNDQLASGELSLYEYCDKFR